MKGPGGKVVTAFAIAPGAPASVAEAYAKFDGLGDAYGRLVGEIDDAREAKAAAVDAARAQLTEAVASGGAQPKKTPTAVEAEHDARIAALEDQIEATLAAIDESGDALCIAIATHRSEWLEALAEEREAAARDLRGALTVAREAASRLGLVDPSAQWVARFEHVATMRGAGGSTQFPGREGFLRITQTENALKRIDTLTSTDLFDLVERNIDPEPPREPRRLKAAAPRFGS